MERLFLDANVLFSAAWRAEAGVRRLWDLPATILISSTYAVDEARRNLAAADQRSRLDHLLESMRVHTATSVPPGQRADIDLAEKDWPILAGAVHARATHLITGDLRDFGVYFGRRLLGVLVLPPARYLRTRR